MSPNIIDSITGFSFIAPFVSSLALCTNSVTSCEPFEERIVFGIVVLVFIAVFDWILDNDAFSLFVGFPSSSAFQTISVSIGLSAVFRIWLAYVIAVKIEFWLTFGAYLLTP